MKKLILLLLLLVPACLSAQTVTDLSDPGSNGVVKRTALGITGPAASSDLIALWTGTCNSTTFLRADGSCQTAGAVSSVFGRTGAVVALANDYTFDLIGAGSNLNTLSLGNAGSLKPLNLGQIASTQDWLQPGLVVPATTGTLAGGSIGSGHSWLIQYTLNTALGETLPSVLLSANMSTLTGAVCNGGGSCTLTITAPTLPSGYTSWNAYVCDSNGGFGCVAPLKLAACTALGAGVNCVMIAAQGTGSALPTTNTAIIQPPNVQATNGLPGWLPSAFFPKDDGNYYPWLGVDYDSADTPTGANGTPLFSYRTFWNDFGGRGVEYSTQNQAYKNALVSINHRRGNGGVVSTNQDRALAVFLEGPSGDASTFYGTEALQVENYLNCNGCNINGSPDGEVAAGSFQLSTAGAATNYSTTGGTQVIRAQLFKNNVGADGITKNRVIEAAYSVGLAATGSTTFAAGTQGTIINAHCDNANASTLTNFACYGLRWSLLNTTARPLNGQVALYAVANSSFSATLGTDYLIRNDNAGYGSLLNGMTVLSGLTNSNPAAALVVNAPVNINGSLTATQSTVPTPSSVVVTGGGISYGYKFVCVDNNGGQAISSQQNSAATGLDPLTGPNPATINVTNSATTEAQYAQCVRIDVYRTATSGTMGLGKVGSLTCSAPAGTVGPTCTAFSDTGIAATGTVPTVNTTGGASIGGDFTLATSKGQHVNTQAANSDTAGTCTLGTNCVVTFTRAYTAAPVCVATDTTAAAAVKVVTTTGGATFTGTGTDVLAYICMGNPN